MKILTPVFLLSVLLCGGCATGYDSSNVLMGGYSETKLAPDMVRVVFRGNSSTRKERAQDLALMRAADLALQAGFPYFTVLEELNDTRRAASGGVPISMPKSEILVQFIKDKPAGGVTFDAAYLIKSVREKYNLK